MQNKTALIPTGSHEHNGVKAQPWQKGVLATAAMLALLSTSLDAQALALGAVTVRSSLGEPLRAEIEVPQISSEEASTLHAAMASPQAFRAAGVEYSSALSGAKVTLHRRANGQAYLRVVGDRPINEPFLGIVIEASWANGRVVRDYTMLVDPPGRMAPTPVTVTPSQTTPPAGVATAPVPAVPSSVAVQTTPASEPVTAPVRAAQAASRRPGRSSAVSVPAAAVSAGSGDQVTVQQGDTAYRIASAHAPDGVSLDQMLIAMLQANPNAFVGGNVNRMKAGAVLNLPSAEQALAVSRRSARQAVLAQTRDFNAFRRGLASRVQSTPTAVASRGASGGIQAQVEDRQAPAPSQDRLTLSKGASPQGNEATTAQSRQAKEQAERVAELNKNISELARLQAESGANAGGSTPPSANSTPGIAVPAPVSAPAQAVPSPVAAPEAPVAPAIAASDAAVAVVPSASASEPVSAASAAGSAASSAVAAVPAAAEAADTASAPAPQKPRVKKVAPPPPPPEPSFLDSLLENPVIPVAGLAALIGLLGFGFYRSRQSKKKDAAPLDSAFIESRLQPDSFFGDSGGQRVNTREADSPAGSSSMVYSPSQLDAAGDVDPVAEADVYLAYGRDMQAEEILKEALRTQPQRAAIHRNLAGIYAKRRDARALEAIATEAYAITHGEGPDWVAITSLGAELDPTNPLYKPGGSPAEREAVPPAPTRRSFGADTEPQTAQLQEKTGTPSSSVPLDLDLDLDLDDAPVRQVPPATHASSSEIPAAQDSTATAAPAPVAAPAPEPAAVAAPAPVPAESTLDFDLDLDLDFAPPSELSASAAPATPPAASPAFSTTAGSVPTDSGMIEFDMDALSVDPDSRSGGDLKTEQPEDADEDPLGTKLALAQEFHAIGDTDGARALIKEVIADASGSLRARAERFLAELS